MRGIIFVVVVLVAAMLGLPPVAAEPPVCTPGAPSGLDGCIPSPLDCATGQFNGTWKSATDDRLATCDGYVDAAGRGHINEYVGGDPNPPCGAIIRNDRMVIGGWQDPNQVCGAYGVGSGYGIRGNRYLPAASSPHGAVATASAHATAAAVSVLRGGGNAVDAAVAAVFVTGVAAQESCGIGGGGFLVYRGADGTTRALDFRERAPAALPAEFEHQSSAWGTGHRVVGVPGTVAGMAAVLDHYGSRSLRRLLEPAIGLAERGVGITARQADVLSAHASRLARYEASRRIYFESDGSLRRPHPVGELLVQLDLAWSLRLIAQKGPKAFYRGEIAQKIVSEMSASQGDPHIPEGDRGVMTAADLADYRVVWREPLRGSYRGHEVLTMPPPTSGGVALLEVLNLVEGFELPTWQHSSADHLHVVAEAKKLAWADRNAYVADPDYVAIPTQQLISKSYAEQRRAEIDLARAKDYRAGHFDGFTPRPPGSGHEGASTAHISVVDGMGTAVSVTCTNEQAYGSAVVVPGTGILLNSQLTDFDEPGTANEPWPGKRPRSSTTPVIVSTAGIPRLVAGGVGGPAIPAGVLLAVSNVIDFGMDPALALDAARVDADACCALFLEQHRVPQSERDSLRARGHSIVDGGQYREWFGPAVQLVGTQVDGHTRFATSDPRDDRAAAVVASG